ncbi:uncharacterized protein METZ01_LOCUS88424 [marine metagenome]|uniref:C2H2-type domain-containing protein n=1 Tax=marine metagenome TaxID=408172 RepID=A0A381V5B3_9ZZZZ
MALNLRGVIPNAAAITSHLPDSVLLIRLKPGNEEGKDMLNESHKRLQAWANGTLPKIYGFDSDIKLWHSPEKPQTIPRIEVLEVEGVSSSSKEICDEISRVCDSLGHHEVRIDVAAGRKEDAAGLARLPAVADRGGGCTVWYTDATSGTSVEIGGGLGENKGAPLSHMTRFWLNGTPILGAKSVLVGERIRGEVLTSVLDSVEEISESTKLAGTYEEREEERKKQVNRLLQDLDDRGIGASKENWGYKFTRREDDKSVGIPKMVFNTTSGYWLERLAALAVIDGWECERVFIGVSLGKPDHEDRMGSLYSVLRKAWGGRHLSRVWSDCRAEGMLPDEFSGLDFLDSKSFNMREYNPPARFRRKNPDCKVIFDDNAEEIGRFADWVRQEWRVLPRGLRDYLTPLCQVRDLDVFAQTTSHCLFIECKLGPESGDKTVGQNKAQIDSIVASSASRGVNYSILAHSFHDIDTWRSGAFDYIVHWSKLRRPEEMLDSVIKSGFPKREWWKKPVDPPSGSTSTVTESVTPTTHFTPEGKVDQGVIGSHPSNSNRRRVGRRGSRGWDGWTPTRHDPPPPTEEVPKGKHYCPECMDSFNSARWLNEHRQETGHSSYKCEECSEILITDRRVVRHSKETGHKTFSGTNCPSERLWVPWDEDPEAQKRLLESGFYDKAIENRWDSGKFCRMLVQETGKEVWKEIYGVVAKNTKASVYFNSVRPGLVLFIQGADGRWYASDPGRGDEKE